MKTASVLACVVPLAAATWDLLELDYTPDNANDYSADTSDCEYPAYFTVSNLRTSGPSQTNLTNISFGFADNETAVTTTCSAETASDGRLSCDDTDVEFVWDMAFVGDDEPEEYKLTMVETICNATYEVSGAWIPTFTCTNSSIGVDCTVTSNATSYTSKYSSLEPVH